MALQSATCTGPRKWPTAENTVTFDTKLTGKIFNLIMYKCLNYPKWQKRSILIENILQQQNIKTFENSFSKIVNDFTSIKFSQHMCLIVDTFSVFRKTTHDPDK